MVLIPGHIQEPETVVSGSLRPYQVDRFVRVVEKKTKKQTNKQKNKKNTIKQIKQLNKREQTEQTEQGRTDRTGQNRTEQDRTGQNRTQQDRTGQNITYIPAFKHTNIQPHKQRQTNIPTHLHPYTAPAGGSWTCES